MNKALLVAKRIPLSPASSLVLGIALTIASLRFNAALECYRDAKVALQIRRGTRLYSTGEPIGLLDILGAEVRRRRRGTDRLASDPTVPLADAARRRKEHAHYQQKMRAWPTGPASEGPDEARSLPVDYWHGEDAMYTSSMAIERSTLISKTMGRLLVAEKLRIIFCPVDGVLNGTIHDFLTDAEGSPLRSLGKYAVRDRERFLTSQGVYRFAFVQHPFTRAVASYLEGISSQDVDSPQYRDFMGRVRGNPLAATERELQIVSLLFYLTFLVRQQPADLHDEFQTQTSLCQFDKLEYHLIGRAETAAQDMIPVATKAGVPVPDIPPEDRANKSEWDDIFSSSKLRSKATKLYTTDLERLTYSATEIPPQRTEKADNTSP